MKNWIQEYEYLWQRQRTDPNWLLLKSPRGGYCVFNKQGSILIIEDDEINEAVCKRMIEAGCEILETLPNIGPSVAEKIQRP
jgi:hypothetical protein